MITWALDKTTISTQGYEGAFLGVSRFVTTSHRMVVIVGEGLTNRLHVPKIRQKAVQKPLEGFLDSPRPLIEAQGWIGLLPSAKGNQTSSRPRERRSDDTTCSAIRQPKRRAREASFTSEAVGSA